MPRFLSSSAQLSVLAFAIIAGCRQPPSTDESARTIAAMRDSLQSSENAGNADGMAALLAEDVMFMPPNAPDISGKAAATEFLRGAFKSVSMAVRYQSQEVVVSGDWAFDRGIGTSTVTPRAGGAPTQGHDRYLWLLRRDPSGSWKYVRVTWSSDVAPAGSH